jgi:hypothetical protein
MSSNSGFNFKKYIQQPEVQAKLKQQRETWVKKHPDKVSWYKYKRHLYLYLKVLQENGFIYKNLINNTAAQIGFKPFTEKFEGFLSLVPKEELPVLGLNKRCKAFRIADNTSYLNLKEEIDRQIVYDTCNPKKSPYKKRISVN